MIWLRMEPEEGAELMMALGHRISDLRYTMQSASPEVVKSCTAMIERAEALQLRIATSLKALDKADDNAWATMLRDMTEDAGEATKTLAGMNPLFTDLRDLLNQELMDEPERVL